MPKKSRRTKVKYRGRSAKLVPGRHPQPELVTAESRSSVKASQGVQDSITRYQHVIPELKYIGILAGSMILILIVLSFVLG